MMKRELTLEQLELVNGGSDSDIEQILDKVTPTGVKNTYNTVKTTVGTIFFYGKTFLDRIF